MPPGHPLAATGIATVPFELLLDVFTFLDGRDIIYLLSTCRALRGLVADESIWRELCLRYDVRDLGPFRVHDPDRSYYDIYTQLLHVYGPLLGLWVSDNPFKGNILEFRIVTESRRVGWEGIVAEMWEFALPSSSFNSVDLKIPVLPEYFECLRIELPRPIPRVVVQDANGVNNDVEMEISTACRSPTMSWVIHHTDNTPTLQVTHDNPIRRHAPHRQGYYLYAGSSAPIDSAVLHPPFPPPELQDRWLADADRRMPPLVEEDDPLIDDSERAFHVGSHSRWPLPLSLFYMAPSRLTDSIPSSITVAAPDYRSRGLEYSRPILSANHISRDIHDLRPTALQAVTSTSRHNPAEVRYFPLSLPGGLTHISGSRNTNISAPSAIWTPQSLEGLWLGSYDTLGTEVLYLKYTDTGEVQAWKVTGNQFIPRGTLSFKFDTSEPASQEVDAALRSSLELDEKIQKETLHFYDGVGVIGGPENTYVDMHLCVDFADFHVIY